MVPMEIMMRITCRRNVFKYSYALVFLLYCPRQNKQQILCLSIMAVISPATEDQAGMLSGSSAIPKWKYYIEPMDCVAAVCSFL